MFFEDSIDILLDGRIGRQTSKVWSIEEPEVSVLAASEELWFVSRQCMSLCVVLANRCLNPNRQ